MSEPNRPFGTTRSSGGPARLALAVALLLVLTPLQGAWAAPPQPAGRSVLLEVSIQGEVGTRKIHAVPVIRTADGKAGTITIEDRPEPGKEEVRSPVLTQVTVRPTIVGEDMRLVSLQLEFVLDLAGRRVTRTFTTTLLAGQPWSFESSDPGNRESYRLDLRATPLEPGDEVTRDPRTGKFVITRGGAR